jgi:hypothetical protein
VLDLTPTFIQEVVGDIVGVGFEPGRDEVRLRADPTSFNCVATSDQVDKALELRGTPVRALLIQADNKTRLLRLGRPDDPPFVPSEEDVEQHLFKRWHELLTRLAK